MSPENPEGLSSLNPYNYQLDILTIVNNEGLSMDVRNMMGECRIYESITNNFLMGELAIIDAITPSLFDQIKFTGQESLRIKFRMGGPENETMPTIDKLFRIYKVSDLQRQDQGQLMYKLSFCSPEFLTSRRFRISKAYKGSHTEIAASMGEEYLKIQVPTAGETGDPLSKGLKPLEPYWERVDVEGRDSNYQFVIPNWTVNYAMNWLCNQAIEDTDFLTEGGKSTLGSITFWYQSAYGDYKIQSLTDMLEDKYLFGEPFIYSPVSENETIEREKATKEENADGEKVDVTKKVSVAGQKIINYQEGEHADFLDGIVYGIFAGEQTTVDFRNKTYWETEWSYFDSPSSGGMIEQEEGKGTSDSPIIRDTPEQLWVGQAVDIDETKGKIALEASRRATPFVRSSSKTSDHNINQKASAFKEAYSIVEYQTPEIFSADVKSSVEGQTGYPKITLIKQAAMKLLKYNTITCQISARTDISAGKIINLQIPAPDTGLSDDSGDERPDNFNSGNHLITEVMWSLMPTELKTNITCMRDTCIERIEDYYAIEKVVEVEASEDDPTK